MRSKTLIRSWTIWFNGLALVFAPFLTELWPSLGRDFCSNPKLTIAILTTVNLLLRFKTRSGLVIHGFYFVLLSACSQYQTLEQDVFYKRDIGIEVNGEAYEGVVTIPRAKKYEITLAPKGDVDMMLLRTCHREFTAEKQTKSFLFIPLGKNKYQYLYEPIPGLEDGRTCPMRIDVYESSKGRHSWAFVDFTHPDYQLKFESACNGVVGLHTGVGVCQAKKETVQRFRFSEPVQFAPPRPAGCAFPNYKATGEYEIEATLGECLYHVRNSRNDMARITLISYSGVLVRSPQ